MRLQQGTTLRRVGLRVGGATVLRRVKFRSSFCSRESSALNRSFVGRNFMSRMAASEGATSSSSDLETIRAEVEAELARHSSVWPQRQVIVGSRSVIIPCGPQDPPDYKEWVQDLPIRFNGRISRLYVADAPGVPTLVELETIKREVWAGLRSANISPPPMIISIDPDSGSVFLRHAPTRDQAFLAGLVRVRATYGRLVRVAIDTVSSGVKESGLQRSR